MFFDPVFELYSTFKVVNMQDFDNEKCSRSWRIALCRFLPPEFGNFTNFPVHCYCTFSSDFANVRANKNSQDQLKLVLNYWWQNEGAERAELAEDFVGNSQ